MKSLLCLLESIHDQLCKIVYLNKNIIITCGGNGRYGNKFFRNMSVFKLSNKFGLLCLFENSNYIGFDFNNKSHHNIKKFKKVNINDYDIIYFSKGLRHFQPYTIYHINGYSQKQPELIISNIINIQSSLIYQSYISRIEDKYKDTYSNNDIFIHFRNISKEIRGIEQIPYLDEIGKLINKLRYSINIGKVYFSTDNFDSNCKIFVEKYNCINYKEDLSTTINFATSRKHLICSSGTFSAVIAVLSIHKPVYVKKDGGKGWHWPFFHHMCEIFPLDYLSY